MISLLNSQQPDFDARLAQLLQYETQQDHAIVERVCGIVNSVRERGDAALLEHTIQLDRFTPASAAALEISRAELLAARDQLDPKVRAALETAAARVRAYHEHQLARSWSYSEAGGTRLGQKITPLDRAGLYVPGGKASYPSSVLMNIIPAKVAGVGELIMVVPTPDGVRNQAVLAAAAIAGIDRVFTVGGAQAVAALAYGTATIPAVDKITGPGNAYVAEAKRQVFGQVGIDMIAGPSEILVLCDGDVSAGANPDWVAMDLFSQAEHDELAQAILLCPDPQFIELVRQSIIKLLPTMPRRAIIAQSLADRGALIQVRDMQEACALSNRIAPEHLELIARDTAPLVEAITHAGAIFVGAYASESLGDYCAGPNHVLPTMRTARFSSPLGVYDFQKRSSLIEISAQDAQVLGPVAATLAYSEGFHAHARSAELRLQNDLPVAPQLSLDHRIANHVRADVKALQAYHVPSAQGMIKLDAMENPYLMPPALQRALGERLAAVALNRYPVPSYQVLKNALAQHYQVPAGVDLILGNGSDELIALLAIATAKPGATILAPEPGFVMYKMSAQLAHCTFVGVPLNADFSLNLPAMLQAIAQHRPAVLYLAYPNNPTGNCWSQADITTLIQAAPGFVVIDEAYQPFATHTWMPYTATYPHVLVMRTVSKLGLAGIRLGYMAGSPALLAQLEKVRPPYNVNVLTEAAALFALEHADVFTAQAALLTQARSKLAADLTPLAVQVFDSQANFVLTRFSNAAAVYAHLLALRIIVKDVSKMHPLLQNCLRLTVGTPEENAAMLAAIASAPLNG
jgi:histidinol dehydrogenase